MTRPADIPQHHHGLVWVFTVAENVADPLAQLGVPLITPDETEMVDLDALAPYGFANYLTEAAGFDAAQVDPDRALLDALRGQALLVFSGALGPEATRFTPGPGLTLIARYGMPPASSDLTPLRSDGAIGILTPPGKPAKSDARIGGMVALAALIFAFVLVFFMIWSAG